jgi:hypothetical protein
MIPNERLIVSERFLRAIQTRIRQLRDHAATDELTSRSLTCEDHRRRQRRLVQTQLDEAHKLADLCSSRFQLAGTLKEPANSQSRAVEGAARIVPVSKRACTDEQINELRLLLKNQVKSELL